MEQKKQSDRQIVAELIMRVLTHKMCVRESLERFPKDNDDISLKCCWHALVHYEADEDLRRRDLNYKQEQDEYLEMLSNILREDKELPRNIIDEYNKYYKGAPTQHSDGFWNNIKRLLRFIQ